MALSVSPFSVSFSSSSAPNHIFPASFFHFLQYFTSAFYFNFFPFCFFCCFVFFLSWTCCCSFPFLPFTVVSTESNFQFVWHASVLFASLLLWELWPILRFAQTEARSINSIMVGYRMAVIVSFTCWGFCLLRHTAQKIKSLDNTLTPLLTAWLKPNTLLSALLKVWIRSWRKESCALNPWGLGSSRCEGRGMKWMQVKVCVHESENALRIGLAEEIWREYFFEMCLLLFCWVNFLINILH